MPDSDGVQLFRAKLAGLVQEHTAALDGVERTWRETASSADERAKEQTEKAQKLVERIRERARAAREDTDRGVQEIKFGQEDEESREEDPEVESLVRGMLNQQRNAAPVVEQSGSTSEGWQVQAGRFGRAEEEQAARSAPPASAPPETSTPPSKPAPPKPAPRRRQPVQDSWDDDDFSERSWLQ